MFLAIAVMTIAYMMMCNMFMMHNIVERKKV